ncbi:MAG: MATE family efflux transporter, partial [Aestuariibacter sp.]|nr:MATE family efflux transporter [Aestuariibacter sp.]
MILANITTPLLGLVDTAVMGHMAVSAPLAGAAIGGLILTQIYWVCGFLRMSATGLSAQARGKQSSEEIAKTFYQTAFVGLVIGLLLLILQQPVLWAGLTLTAPSEVVSGFAETYFNVRVWGAPAALSNIALIGWLVGQQKTRAVLFIQVVGNLLNAGLDLLFVWSFGMGVEGVALASVIAEYTMAVMGFCVAIQHVDGVKPVWQWFSRSAQKVLMKLNGDMLLRNLALQGCLAFLTIQGARYGETATA